MDWVNAAIAGASAIGGGLVVALSNVVIRKADAKDRSREALLSAIIGYLHILELIGLEAARQPRPSRTVSALNNFIERRTPQLDYTTGRIHEAIFTPHLRGLMERYSLAANQLLMVAPDELLEDIGRVNDLLADIDGPEPGWMERWQDARAELIRACRNMVGPEAE